MDIYDMLENGMSVEEIKAEVDKVAELHKQDKEQEAAAKEENIRYAAEDLYESLINYIEATGDVDAEILESEGFKENLMKVIDDFRDQLKAYAALVSWFKDFTDLDNEEKEKEKDHKEDDNDLKDLISKYF